MKAITKEVIFEQMKKRWYAQGFNCTPLLLAPCASSGFYTDPTLGDHFKSFLFEYKEGYGKMYYPVDDLERLGAIILKKIKQDKDFIKKARARYEQESSEELSSLAGLLKQDLTRLSNEEFIALLKKAITLLRTSVGRGHIIEPFSLTTDDKIKDMLSKYVPDPKQLNIYLSLLSTPTEKSLLNERDEDLYRISLIKDQEKRKEEVKKHLEKFFWVRNTYAGKATITVEDIEDELKTVQKYEAIDFAEIKRKKQRLIKELNLDKELVMLLEALELVTNWQDARKKNILVAIDYAEVFIAELSRRLNIKHALLRYLSYNEINMELFSKNKLKEMLLERESGMVHFITDEENEGILTKDDYEEFHHIMGAIEKEKIATKEFNGLSASTGTAVGKVKICKSIEDIKKVEHGDILVASMTRPEYLPAMKKAAAIVTDEGGITCHAAIVARELGKPCVIATKIATKVLKDGDLVEVKATHALIIKIK